MMQTACAIAAAAIAASSFVAFPSLSPQVEAGVQPVKADRADTRPLATECSERGWPYYETSCLRDTRNAFGEAHAVRFVSTHRKPAGATTTR